MYLRTLNILSLIRELQFVSRNLSVLFNWKKVACWKLNKMSLLGLFRRLFVNSFINSGKESILVGANV